MFESRALAKTPKLARRYLVAQPNALTQEISLFKSETLGSLTSRLLEGHRLLVIDISSMWVRTVQSAREAGVDADALNDYLDAHQRIILRDGARVGPKVKSGFVED